MSAIVTWLQMRVRTRIVPENTCLIGKYREGEDVYVLLIRDVLYTL